MTRFAQPCAGCDKPFFTALSARYAQELLKRTQSRRVSAGQVLLQQGDPGDGLYGTLSGRVAFTVDSPGGKALILNVLGPGEFFGEIALLDGKGRTATGVVRDACTFHPDTFVGMYQFWVQKRR